jgi:uncharacterized protein (TIGR00297 family)
MTDGQRDIFQVLCNGFIPCLFSILYLIDCGPGQRPVDFMYNYNATWYTIAILASLSCSCGDTLASELGPVFGSGETVFHILKWRAVPKGTNGGISFVGTIASIFGGFFVGLSYYVTLRLFLLFDDYDIRVVCQRYIIIISSFAGFFGSIVDSILGGYFQYSGFNKKTKLIVDSPGPDVEHISGYNLLSNNQVNLFSTIITSYYVPLIAFKIYKNIQ